MYISQCIYVRWSNSLSKPFSAQNVVRQGSVVSGLMFNIYMYLDILLCKLKDKGVGCHIGHMYAGCLAYADITLLAPSVGGLQKMLQVCEECGFEYFVEYNSGKK